MARVLPVPAPASTHIGPLGVRRDLALLGVEGVEDRVGSGVHGQGRHRVDPRCRRVTPPTPPAGLWTTRREAIAGEPGVLPDRVPPDPTRGARCPPPSRTGQTLPAPGTVTMFTTTWCGYCRG